MFALTARFKIKSGHVDEVIRYLQQAATESRKEPGCHFYVANQDVTDPEIVVMYEQYTDEAAFQAHLETEHFKQIVAAKVVPLLEDRVRQTFTVVPDE